MSRCTRIDAMSQVTSSPGDRAASAVPRWTIDQPTYIGFRLQA